MDPASRRGEGGHRSSGGGWPAVIAGRCVTAQAEGLLPILGAAEIGWHHDPRPEIGSEGLCFFGSRTGKDCDGERGGRRDQARTGRARAPARSPAPPPRLPKPPPPPSRPPPPDPH